MQNREDLDLHVERRRQGTNRRRTGRMIAALAVIVIAGLLLLAQRGRVGPKAPDAKEAPQTEAPADEAGVFVDRSEKDVVSLKVENGGSPVR